MRRRNIAFLSYLVAFALLAGCTTSKYTLISEARLDQYEYVVISRTGDVNAAVMFGLEVEIAKVFPKYGFSVLGDKEVNEAGEDTKERTLVVRGAMSSSDAESVCVIVLEDFKTGRALLSARGAYGLGMSQDGDRAGAIRKAMKQVDLALNESRM